MDSAELWLLENDPNYVKASQDWKHLKTGEYVCPPQEIPWGNADDIQMLVDAGEARYLPVPARRACESCGYLFVPNTPWQRFCREPCRKRVANRRLRGKVSLA